jgi:hypothetical protein
MPTLTASQMIVSWIGVAFVAALAILFVKYYKPRTVREREAEQAKAATAALARAVNRGTHDDRGRPLCRICGTKDSPTLATEFGFLIMRSDGLIAWVRQRIGAPARLSIGRNIDADPCYCRECAFVAGSELEAELLEFEKMRREQVSQNEVILRRIERVGLDEKIQARIEAHDREELKRQGIAPAKVLPLTKPGTTTEHSAKIPIARS